MIHVPQSQSRIYRQNSLQKIMLLWYLLITGCLVLFSTWSVIHHQGLPTNSLYLLLVIGMGIVFLFGVIVTWNNRVEISFEGIAYYGAGFRIYTPWDNVIGLANVKHPSSPFQNIPVFVFKQPARLGVSIREGKRAGQAVIEHYWILERWGIFAANPLTYTRCLPLPRNIISQAEWEWGEFGRYSRQYAPQVFGKSTEAK